MAAQLTHQIDNQSDSYHDVSVLLGLLTLIGVLVVEVEQYHHPPMMVHY